TAVTSPPHSLRPRSFLRPSSSMISARTTGLHAAFLGVLAAILVSACGGAHSRYVSHLARAQQYLAQGNLDKASIEFRNALQIQPKDPDALYGVGRVGELRGNFREAVGLYQAAVDVRPDFPAARANLGKIFVFAGDSHHALDIVAPGLAQHPDD